MKTSPFIALGLSLAIILGEDQTAPTDPAPSTNRAPLAMVFEMERPAERDLLLPYQGESLSGIVLNPSLRLRASYASMAFDLGRIAGLELDHQGRQPACLITVNGNRFSGILEESSFSLQLPDGNRMEIRREKISKIIFHRRPRELEGIPQGRWIGLRNGDVLSGAVRADPLPMDTTRGKKQFPWHEIASLAFHLGASPTLTLRQGEVLREPLDLEDLPVLLDVGPAIKLHTDYIEIIQDHSHASTGSVTGPSQRGRLPYAVVISPNATNVAGMVWIPAGQFTMGSPSGEAGRDQDEGPQTQVTIEPGFWIGKYEVTQKEYLAVTGNNPSNNTEDPSRPVEKVSWNEAMDFCETLTQQARAANQLPPGFHFRLPSEAEWEYACRAGAATRFSFGEDKSYSFLENYAWFVHNSDSTTHPVGMLRPNPWGLFDMHGNVWEWCLDRWEGFLPGGAITNRPSRTEGTLRVARGGSWLYEGWACRSANRDDLSPANRCSDVGFRIVLASLEGGGAPD